jgi:hypothetical protein
MNRKKAKPSTGTITLLGDSTPLPGFLVKMSSGETVVVTKNTHYFSKDRPYTKVFEFRSLYWYKKMCIRTKEIWASFFRKA